MANSCLKGAFCIVNILYTSLALITAAGAVFFSLAVKEMTDLRNYESHQLDTFVHWPQVLPYIFVIIGALVLFVMCCGCCGIGFDSKALLITYNVFITMVILILSATGCVAITIATHKSQQFINETIYDVFKQATLRPDVAVKFGEIEQFLHCCGADGIQNYFKELPNSCCDSINDVNCNYIMNQRRGCIEVANHWVSWVFVIGTTASGVTAILCVISLILAIAILRNMRMKTIS